MHYNRWLDLLRASYRYVLSRGENWGPLKTSLENNYALRLRDDSMKEAYIIDGDIVIIEQTEVAENSRNVVFKNQR